MALHPEVKKFLSEAGRKGGISKSERKQELARENGKKGGRPPTKKRRKK